MRRRLFLLLICLFAAGCAADARLNRISVERSADSLKLHQIFDQYFEEYLQLFPTFATSIGDHRYDDQLSVSISDEHRGKQRELYLRCLAELAEVTRDNLGQQDRLNYAVFERLIAQRLEGLKFSQHLLPVRQLNSLAVEFPLMGSGKGVYQFRAAADYDRFLNRIEKFQDWVETAIQNMRQGTAHGVVQPRVVMERTLPQIEAMIVVEPKQSLFFQPILQMPDHVRKTDEIRLTKAYTRAIGEHIVPAYRKLRDFIREEYLAKARASVAMADLPEGNAWYDHLVKAQTTTNLTPDEIFQLGMDEIERINNERERLRRDSNFQGSIRAFAAHLAKNAPPGFRTREDLIKGYERIRDKATPQLAKLFGRLRRTRWSWC